MRIYVSSTTADLADYRAAVMAAVKGIEHDCLAMEYYQADNRTPVEKVLQDVASCDIYIGIFAWRYGFIPPNFDLSITELEYRQAVKERIPTLIFLLNESVPWLPDHVDEGKRGERAIDHLREKLKKEKLVSFFNGPDDLRVKVIQAIHVLPPKEGPRLVPPPSTPKVELLHLPETGPAQFGRDQEIKQLDDAWNDGRTNIISIVAWGGVGKTALIKTWLARMAKDNFRFAKSVFGWSFYDQGMENAESSADVFTAEALRWFGDPNPNLGLPWENGQRLAELVSKERSILILDGLEVLQHTEGPNEGKLKDQSLQALLQKFAYQNPGLCLISTRFSITDLKTFVGNTVEEIQLDHLSAEEGAQLLSSLGVHGTKEEMVEAAREFMGHPLALTLLGSYLVEFYDGVVSRWREVDQPEPGQARRIMESYERMLGQGPELDILRLLGLFNGPIQEEALNTLRRPPVIPGLTENLLNLPGMKWRPAIQRLRHLKLVAERNLNRPDVLDTHPLVRHHFSKKLKNENAEAWREANNRLFEYYKELPQKLPDNLAEMVYLFQAVTHGCRAGRHQEAWDEVYWPRIRRGEDGYSVLTLGAYGADLVALTNFFNEDWDRAWDRPVSTLTDLAKARVLTETAFDLRGLGRLEEAIPTQRDGLNIHQIQGHHWSAANAAGNLSEMLVLYGELKKATDDAKLSIELAQLNIEQVENSGDQKLIKDGRELLVVNRATLADALHQRGQFEAALQHFHEAEALYKEFNPEIQFLHALRGYHFCDLLLGKGHYDEVLERANAMLVVDQQRLYAIGLAHLALARMHMRKALASDSSDFSEASDLMKQAIYELRKAGHQELIFRALLASAKLDRVMGLLEQSEATLKEAFDAVIRNQMRLHQADTYFHYTYLYLDLNRIDQAKDNFIKAREMIRTMGYHRRDNDLKALEARILY